MEPNEWRDKHRKCKFCKRLVHLQLPPFCIGKDTWCKAKKKLVNDNISRPFCALFAQENRNGDNA